VTFALALSFSIKHLVLACLSSNSAIITSHAATNEANDHVTASRAAKTISSRSTDTQISHTGVERHWAGTYFAVLTSTFDSFVAVFVQVGKVLPYLFISSMNDITIFDGSELRGESSDCGDMEFVLVGL
jgi:hypothetical protein